MKILGGEVYGGVAKMQAGNIRIWGGDLTVGGNAYIYDGDAQGTNTVNNNIWVQGTDDTTGQSLTIEGTPVITGDVFVGNGTVTMSGAPTISMGDNIGFRFSGGTAATAWATANTQVDVSGLTEGASIVVTAADGAVLSKACASAEDAARIAGYFSCSDSSLTVAAATDNTLVVKASVVEEPPMDVFAPWNYEGRAYCEACEAYADWIPMADDVAVDLSQKISGTEAASVNRPGTVSDGGHHHAYLAESYTFAGNWGAVTAGSLCLHTNGNTVTYKGRLFVSGAEFNVLGNGKITSDCSNVYGDGVLVAANSATVTLYGGTLETTAENGGPALILRAGADVTMKDGAVIDGTGVARCVKFEAGATNPVSFTMEGGIIRNGFFSSDATGRKTAGQDDSWGISNGYNGGGNVWVQYGTFTMNGGVIQDGIAGAGLKDDGATYNQSYGGNVYIASGGTMEMNNQAVVSGGKAASSWIGGNIYMTTNTAALTMNGSSQILNGSRIATDNAAKVNTGSGANIFCNGGTITMNGSSQITNIAENKTDTAGNVRLNGETNNAKLVMNGEALISGGSANGNGGSVELRQTNGTATLEMNGGTITGGNANAGGNIYNNGGTLDLNAGTVTLGAANSSGGNIYHAAGTLEQAADHEVTGGTAAADEVNGKGGNLFLGASADMNGTVSGGNTNYSGGNAHLSGSTTVLTIGTTGQFLGLEEGSTVKYGGNIATEGSSTVTVYGTVADGHAVTRGGNFDIMGAGILNIENGAQVKDGVGVNAGNIFAQNASAKININGGAITGGQGTSAGNLYIMKATVTMTGGSISGGSNTGTAAAHNVFLTTDSTMNMSGGTVYGTDGAEKAGTGIRINSAVLNLSGDASVIRADGIHQFVIQCQTTGLIQIDNSWEGTAAVSFNNTYDYGEVIDPHANDTDATRDYYVVCGTLGSDGSFTRGGSYANGHLIYAQPARGCPEIVGVDGLCYVAGYAVVDTESNTTTWSTTADLAAVNGSETKYLLAGAAVALNGETVYIDALAGINVTGSGTVYGIDPANADFTTASTGSITAGEDVTLASDVTFGGVRYIKLADGSVHAIKMGISGVSLRPTAVGLYYKATYKCDAKLAAAIDAYGVVLSVYDMPGADFADVATDQFTVREDFASLYADNTVTANSGSVFGIMKDGRENNQERGEMKIYANAYILVEGAAIYVGDNDNAGKSTEDEGFDGVALSLYDVLKKIDDKVTDGSLTLTPTNIEQITELYGKIKAWGVNWTFTNIQ